jgi:hypothetical protein
MTTGVHTAVGAISTTHPAATANSACDSVCEENVKKQMAHQIPLGSPAGSNMTAGANMTGATGNTTGAHSSSIPTTKPGGEPFNLNPPQYQVPQIQKNYCTTATC